MKDKLKENFFVFPIILFITGLLVVGNIGEGKEKPKEEIKVDAATIVLNEKEIVMQQNEQTGVLPKQVTNTPPTETEQAFATIDCTMSREKQEWISCYCESVGIEYELVMAIIKNESNFTEDIISKTSDYGYMQINIFNHKWLKKELGITNLCEMKDNIKAGTYILKILSDKYTDTNKILMAYNMGEPAARKLWNKGTYSSKYSRQVVQTLEEYRNR